MSKFLKINENVLSASDLHKKATFYFLDRCQQEANWYNSTFYLDEEDDLWKFKDCPEQSSFGNEEQRARLLNAANHRLRMYGTAREFSENLKIYGNFTGNDIFFSAHLPYQIQTDPIIYRSLKNEVYICKADISVILHNIIFSICPAEDVAITSFYLKSLEVKHNKKLEFVRFDPKVFEEIEKELRVQLKKNEMTVSEKEQLMGEKSELSFDEGVEKIKQLAPNVWEFMSDSPFRKHIISYYCVVKLIRFVNAEAEIKSLDYVIDKRPELFLPGPKTVRIFEDGEQRFVMKADLSDDLDAQKSNFLFTIDAEEAIEKYGDQIEFIRYPIRRAKHRAVPITGPVFKGFSRYFYVLAIDVFFETMREIILGAQIFQNYKFEKSAYVIQRPKLLHRDIPDFANVIKEMEKVFDPECLEPYFIETNAVMETKRSLRAFVMATKRAHVKYVRHVKSNGFTVENLKDELAYLEVVDAFPEIQDYAEVVYEHVDSVKKERFLRTCDLFDAVEYCQMICALNRYPNLKKFVHNQKGCGRIPGLKCEKCEKASEIQKSIKILKINDDPQKPPHKNPPIYKKCQESSGILIETQKTLLEIYQNQVKEMEKKMLEMEKEHKKQQCELKKENEFLLAAILKLAENQQNAGVIADVLKRLKNSSISDLESDESFSDCVICRKTINSPNGGTRCPLCESTFHSNCSLNWLKDYKHCPACKKDFPGI